MTYEIETISPVEKQITVRVPAQEVDIAIEATIAGKRESFDKKGFRKDKIPDSLIFTEQKAEILDTAAQQIFSVRVAEARKLYRIFPLNHIQIQSEAPLEKGADFTFRFIVEILPDLELPELTGVEVEVQKVVVTEADIDWIVASLQEQLSTLELIDENRLAADGDVAVFDFESLGEFKTVMGMSGTSHKLELGTGDTLEDFETIIKSLKPGESKTDIITYPTNFPNPVLCGKQVETKVSLKELNRKILPEVDEAFAQKVARVETVIEMREIMRQRHNHRLAAIYQQDAQRRLLHDLLQRTEIPLIPAYVEQNLEEMIGNYTMAMQQRGLNTTEISEQLDEKRKQFLPDAEAAARRQLFLLAVARKEQMKLESQEIEAEIKRQAAAAETEPEQFMLEVQQSGLIRNIKDNLMMGKVIRFLYDSAEKKPVDSLRG